MKYQAALARVAHDGVWGTTPSWLRAIQERRHRFLVTCPGFARIPAFLPSISIYPPAYLATTIGPRVLRHGCDVLDIPPIHHRHSYDTFNFQYIRLSIHLLPLDYCTTGHDKHPPGGKHSRLIKQEKEGRRHKNRRGGYYHTIRHNNVQQCGLRG